MHKSQKIPTVTLIMGIYLSFVAEAEVKRERAPGKQVATPVSLAGGRLLPEPSVRIGKLEDGFTYYIRQNKEPKSRVVFTLASKAGSILETDEQQGLAHFIEHMSFNGTRHFPKSELVDYLQKSGTSLSADMSAYTSFDETIYQLPLPSDNPEVLKNGIQIMRDWAQGAILDSLEIEKERGVIIEEGRTAKDVSERMRKQTLPLMLNGSRYAFRLPIGKEEVILNSKPEAIRSYYQDWYRPNLQALIVVGDINVEEIQQIIKAKFSDLKNPVYEKPRTKYRIPLTGKNQFIAVTDKEMIATVVQVMIKHREPEFKTINDHRASLIRELFNQMLSSRYEQLSRKTEPSFLEGSAGIEGLLGGLNRYTVSVTAKPGELEKGFKAVWREGRRVQVFGFSRKKIMSDSFVKEYLQNFLQEKAIPGFVREMELVREIFPGITINDINVVSKECVQDTNRDIIVMAPDKDKYLTGRNYIKLVLMPEKK